MACGPRGSHLRATGHRETAIATWDQVIKHNDADPASGCGCLSPALRRRGRAAGAHLTHGGQPDNVEHLVSGDRDLTSPRRPRRQRSRRQRSWTFSDRYHAPEGCSRVPMGPPLACRCVGPEHLLLPSWPRAALASAPRVPGQVRPEPKQVHQANSHRSRCLRDRTEAWGHRDPGPTGAAGGSRREWWESRGAPRAAPDRW